ncbi:MAG: hypothetical protein ACM3U2_16445 [Deltaproteobacteria bacterium]
MPTFDWQLSVALFAVAAAASFLIRRGLTMLRAGKKSAAACGSCGSCAATTNAPTARQSASFVPLETLTRDKEK